jgi:hypothetical protein
MHCGKVLSANKRHIHPPFYYGFGQNKSHQPVLCPVFAFGRRAGNDPVVQSYPQPKWKGLFFIVYTFRTLDISFYPDVFRLFPSLSIFIASGDFEFAQPIAPGGYPEYGDDHRSNGLSVDTRGAVFFFADN